MLNEDDMEAVIRLIEANRPLLVEQIVEADAGLTVAFIMQEAPASWPQAEQSV